MHRKPVIKACTSSRATIIDRVTHTKLMCARILRTEAEKQRGLANRRSLPNNEGYLFVFNSDDKHGIWMKDMRMNIDIVWIDAHKRVVSVRRDVSPSTYPEVFTPTKPARYVLELAAGGAQNLLPGQRLEFLPDNL